MNKIQLLATALLLGASVQGFAEETAAAKVKSDYIPGQNEVIISQANSPANTAKAVRVGFSGMNTMQAVRNSSRIAPATPAKVNTQIQPASRAPQQAGEYQAK